MSSSSVQLAWNSQDNCQPNYLEIGLIPHLLFQNATARGMTALHLKHRLVSYNKLLICSKFIWASWAVHFHLRSSYPHIRINDMHTSNRDMYMCPNSCLTNVKGSTRLCWPQPNIKILIRVSVFKRIFYDGNLYIQTINKIYPI